MKKIFLSVIVLTCSLSAFANECEDAWNKIETNDYYSVLRNWCDRDLYEEIHVLTSTNHIVYDYKDVKKILKDVDRTEKWGEAISLYSPNEPYQNPKNVEHIWPKSKGAKHLPAKSDLNHLRLTNPEINSRRGNFPFCEVEKTHWKQGNSRLGTDAQNIRCFEPDDYAKGIVARSTFYFSARYMLPIDEEQETVLRKWHKQFPPDADEIARNERVFELQENRNPFIDHPELVDLIEDF